MISSCKCTVIIPTTKRLAQLEPTLVSLSSLANGPAETIVVQNAISDNDYQQDSACRKIYSKQFKSLHLRVIHELIPGLLAGRHRGAQESTAELLVYIDDDVTFTENWLLELIQAFDDPATVLAGGPCVADHQSPPPAWLDQFWQPVANGGRMMAQLSLIELNANQPIEVDPTLVWGLNYAIRRSTLLTHGGFHPDCVPDRLQHFQGDGETGLSHKIIQAGEKAIYNPQAGVFHKIGPERQTAEYFDKRYFYQGVCDSYTEIRSGILEKRPKQLLSTIETRCRTMLRHLKSLAFTENPADDTSALASRFKNAYHRGIDFHQSCVLSSPALLAWVRRESYLDFQYPQLEPDFSPSTRKPHDEKSCAP